jgi:DNA modification methylase
MPGIGIIINHDTRALPLPDESVDLIVTSPPYFALRDYKDGDKSLAGQIGAEPTPEEFLEALWECSREWWRLLTPGGSLWVNLGDKYNSAQSGQQSGTLEGGDAAKRLNGRGHTAQVVRRKSLLGLPWRYAIGMTDGKGDPDEKGWILRAEVIWAKPNGLPESVRDRVARKHEQWFHFTKSERYFSAVDAIREPHCRQWTPGRNGGHAHKKAQAESGRQSNLDKAGANTLGKLPSSIWTVATEPLKVPAELGVEHFAAFPTEFPRRVISGWAPTRGVCAECGEGLRPVIDKKNIPTQKTYNGKNGFSHSTSGSGGVGYNPIPMRSEVQVTGWACTCDTPGTTRPAVVLDPFGGTGTTAAVAKALGCIGISNDLSASYTKLAKWRIDGDGYTKIERKVKKATKSLSAPGTSCSQPPGK